MCMQTLKERIEDIQKDVLQREHDQRRAQLLLGNMIAIHSETLNELEKVHEDLQIAMSSSTSRDGESCSLLPPPKVHTINNLAPHSLIEKSSENLQQKVKYEEKNMATSHGEVASY